jgi:hypothetical protein
VKSWKELTACVREELLREKGIPAQRSRPRARAKAKPPLDPECTNPKTLELKPLLRACDVTEP